MKLEKFLVALPSAGVSVKKNLLYFQPSFLAVKITLFYIIYYSFLSAFFIVMLLAFFRTLDDTQPTWKMESGGLIGSNPAMGFRPGPPDNQIESTLIWFR